MCVYRWCEQLNTARHRCGMQRSRGGRGGTRHRARRAGRRAPPCGRAHLHISSRTTVPSILDILSTVRQILRQHIRGESRNKAKEKQNTPMHPLKTKRFKCWQVERWLFWSCQEVRRLHIDGSRHRSRPGAGRGAARRHPSFLIQNDHAIYRWCTNQAYNHSRAVRYTTCLASPTSTIM